MTHTRSRRIVAVGAALLALQALAGPAAADTELGHSGSVGVHRLTLDRYVDSQQGYGGAICYYYSTTTTTPLMTRLTVRRPVVFARNRTSGTDSQVVGWRPRLQRKRLDGTWANVLALPIQRKTATDTTKAVFAALAFQSSQIPDSGRLRIVVDMFWYGPGATVAGGGTIAGRAYHRVDYYEHDFWYQSPDGSGGTHAVDRGSCLARHS